MTLLVSDVASVLQHRLGGKTSLSTVVLCNQAGHHLTSMHEWNWLARPAVPIALVANQESAKLPADFGRVIARQGTGLKFVELEQVIALRSQSLGSPSGWGYAAAVSYKQSAVTGALEPRLEIAPTPTASDSTTYKLAYRAAWQDLRDDRVTIPLPTQGWLDALYLEIVIAFAQGYEEHDIAGVSTRLSAVRMSDLFASAVMFDGQRVSNLGQMDGGWYPASSDVDWSLFPASIGGPGI